ncbi:hypothetical protein Clacol_008198 [Clathrus columnatus]|uniref:non-specific serine/threonine protein kinase n=1 Tax=Clathrus columnatus TaxID=1419009 RepID=A0AAV5ANE6_9AGAM|nr:hypothetical protein Clacol_008198 [Clathrus columnatus]
MPESEAQSGDGEGQEADKPPHGSSNINVSRVLNSENVSSLYSSPITNGRSGIDIMPTLNGYNNVAKPSPARISIPVTTQVMKIGSNTGYSTPSTAESPFASDSEWGPSPPSTRPPSRAINNAYSKDHTSTTIMPSEDTICPTAAPPPGPPSRPGSVKSLKSSDGEGKFTLKDLLASAPKLARKSSQRSSGGSSRKSDSDRSDTSLLKKYGVCERVAIGKGATSVVRLAHKWDRSEEKLYAVKEFRKRRKNETEKEYVKKLTAEFCISSTLHHVNIVETVDLVQDEQQRWCEVMEYCPGGDLYAAIKKGGMSPSEVECCFKQILTGVAYLHGQGVAHRDIKPENLFFDACGHLKIGDYGASTVYRLPWETTVHMSTGLCGSEPYIAPEQFTQKTYDARLVDIWACGIVYYCLHFQELPWRVAQLSDPLYAAYAAACASSSSTCPQTISNLSPRACRSLLRRMLEPDPKARCLIEETVKHSWIQSIEVCTEVKSPSHVHIHARDLVRAHAALANTVSQ